MSNTLQDFIVLYSNINTPSIIKFCSIVKSSNDIMLPNIDYTYVLI